MASDEITIDLQSWAQSQDTSIELDVHGKIIDYIDPSKHRENTKEERIRQLLVRSLHKEYGYEPSRIAIEVPIFSGAGHREVKDSVGRPIRADVIIYKTPAACKRREQGEIFAIFETKQPEEREGYRQLTSYIFPTSAEGGGWTNGLQIKCYRRIFGENRSSQDLRPWPGFPKAGQSWDAVGRYKKNQLIIPHNLKPIFEKCHNAIYRDGISSEDVALDMVRILLAKRHDELKPGQDCAFYCTPEEYTTQEGRRNSARRVRELFEEERDANLDVFDAQEKITASDTEIAEVISQLQMYSFTKAELDVIGTAYEVYVASHLKGERGQYFTNRLLIKLIVSILDPSETDIVLDPACGSGGFLIAALQHVRKKIASTTASSESKEAAVEQIRRNLFGIDISPKLVKVAQANMMLGKDGHTGIARADSLSNVWTTLPDRILSRCGKGKASIVITNPPFGSSAQHRITKREILDGFDLGYVWEWSKEQQTFSKTDAPNNEGHPPEVLFMERCLQWAKPGGKVGIVMARGQVDNIMARPMRWMLLNNCQILAVINAHEDSFQPFNGSKTTLVMVRKLKQGERLPRDYNIFMGISKKIGQNSRGEPIFKTDDAGQRIIIEGLPVLDHDIDLIIESYKQFQRGQKITHPFCFSVKRSQIIGPDLSLNPIQYLPSFNESVRTVVSLGNRDGWTLKPLGEIAKVFNGPRFKRPYAVEGVESGQGIMQYYTGTALTQVKGENIKYLDINRSTSMQKRMIDELIIRKDWILITDSGTVGRVIYTQPYHDGTVATNNLIRVIIEDDALRGYVYEFLQTDLGQHQLKKTVYGTNQEHLEPRLVKEVLIPIPNDEKVLKNIGKTAIAGIKLIAKAHELHSMNKKVLAQLYALERKK